MTWSISHTITYNTNADNHTALTYLFDTYLPSKGWTTAAHPTNPASFRRKAKFTCLNVLTNTNYSMYHWVDWSSTSPTSLYWYEDATYTTTPGDLCNDSTNSQSSQYPMTLAGENWKFCTSTENANTALVLKGGKVAFYWPGITEGLFWPDPAWAAGSTDNKGTWICPVMGWYYNSFGVANSPVTTNTGTIYYMVPSVGMHPSASASGHRLGGNYIGTNFSWMYSQNSTSSFYPDSSSHIGFTNGGHTDVGVWQPASIYNSSDCRQPFAYSTNGVTLQIGSNYWYKSFTDLGRQDVIFNFGTVDPLA
jgi:hypothetical protein